MNHDTDKLLALEHRLQNEAVWMHKRRHEIELLTNMAKADHAELEKAKRTILRLEREKQVAVREAASLRKNLDKYAKAYDKLSKSKLGRLTLAYWRFKDGHKKSGVKR